MTREAELRAGDDSKLAYENWLETRDDALVQEIEESNAEDCKATSQVRLRSVAVRAGRCGRRRPTRTESASPSTCRCSEDVHESPWAANLTKQR